MALAADKPRTSLVAGSTGLIGQALLRQLSPAPNWALARRADPAWATVPGLKSLLVDFGDLAGLPAADDAYCCLGTTIKVAGSQQAFKAVDLHAVVAFARAARLAGCSRFGVVSALGADASSSVFYNRVKGEMEAAVAALGFASVVVARPSLLVGDRAALGQPVRSGELIGLRFSRALGPLIPLRWRPVEAAVVARALRRALAEARPGLRVMESAELQTLGREPG